MSGEIYTEIILDLYKNPQNKGEIHEPDIEADGGNPSCGDYARFTMLVENDIIRDIKFYGSGCAISVASESLLTQMAKGKTIKEAAEITKEELFAELGNIIQTRLKCALLGLAVLKKGLEEYEKGGGKKTVVKGTTI